MDFGSLLALEMKKKTAAHSRVATYAAAADLLETPIKTDDEQKSTTTSSTSTSTVADPQKKYIRKGDLDRLQRIEYAKRQKELEEKRKEKEAAKERENAQQTEVHNSPSKKKPETTPSERDEGEDTFNIPSDEVVRRLRAKSQPIRLFAETDKARKIRLRALELMEERSEGQRNDFAKTLGQYESNLDMEALKRQAGEDVEDGGEGAGRKKKRREEAVSPEELTAIGVDMLQTHPEKVHTLVYIYLKRLLKEWEQELRNQPDDVRRSNAGKLAAAMQKQSAEYIKPFFRLLKRKEVEADVMGRVTEIIHFMQNREYVNANDAYLRLSIGNAPWPIGVTMVGIHERSSREKIFSSSVAHVLNDEQARKWIQSVKRIMTFCQTKYPPPDNSQLF